MPRVRTNLYKDGTVRGHYIYKVKNKTDRYMAQIKNHYGTKSGLFYSYDDAETWIEAQHPWAPLEVINT